MTETIAALEARRDLLKEINDLAERHLATLKAIKECSEPDLDEINAAAGHLATLKAIEEHSEVDADEINAAAGHLATLNAIEEHEVL